MPESGSRPRAASSARRAAAALLAFVLLVVGGVELLGLSTRVLDAPAEVLLVRNGREALKVFRARHLRGRILVHAGRFLHFVDDIRDEAEQKALKGAGSGRALDALLDELAGPVRYLWIAASSGIARQIVYVSPPASLDARLGALGWTHDVLPASIPWEVYPRTLEASFPRISEHVILEICASWFDDDRAPDPLGPILESGLDPDLVIVNLAEDAEDVSEQARERARGLAAILGARLAKGRR